MGDFFHRRLKVVRQHGRRGVRSIPFLSNGVVFNRRVKLSQVRLELSVRGPFRQSNSVFSHSAGKLRSVANYEAPNCIEIFEQNAQRNSNAATLTDGLEGEDVNRGSPTAHLLRQARSLGVVHNRRVRVAEIAIK